MLGQEEIAFLKALSCAQPSPALLKELRKALANVRKRRGLQYRRRAAAPLEALPLLPTVHQRAQKLVLTGSVYLLAPLPAAVSE